MSKNSSERIFCDCKVLGRASKPLGPIGPQIWKQIEGLPLYDIHRKEYQKSLDPTKFLWINT